MNADRLKSKLENNFIHSSHLLGNAKVLDVNSRNSSEFNDPRYFPFYYYLGKEIGPSKVHQIGAKLGLIAACFMQGADTIVDWIAMELSDGNLRPPINFINSNIKMFCKASDKKESYCTCFEPKHLLIGGELDFKIEIGMLTEKYSSENTELFLDFFWNNLKSEGLLVVDYIHDEVVKDIFMKFCRLKNRDPDIFNTRYGVGILKR